MRLFSQRGGGHWDELLQQVGGSLEEDFESNKDTDDPPGLVSSPSSNISTPSTSSSPASPPDHNDQLPHINQSNTPQTKSDLFGSDSSNSLPSPKPGTNNEKSSNIDSDFHGYMYLSQNFVEIKILNISV